MKERPILFSGPMVRAILDGRKTQTRRLVKPQPINDLNWYPRDGSSVCGDIRSAMPDYSPYGVPGDRLWVREAWRALDVDGSIIRVEKAGDRFLEFDHQSLLKARRGSFYRAMARWPHWRPARFMPREACGILLKITEVRVQRLQEISDAEAKAEGLREWDDMGTQATARQEFAALWEQLNGKRAPWASNPWVWAITFRRCE